ncbi:2'-5' RNA ligase family protein [Nocardia grenadensis]|nr:2'-5' RNA ligase family protein [Nocardia grenadensis]
MVQSVELLLDEAAEQRIRRQWELLAEAGLPGLGQSRHDGATENHRPHITVAVARQIWPRIEQELDRLPFRPFPVRLGGVLVFGARRPILVRAVVPSEQLLA